MLYPDDLNFKELVIFDLLDWFDDLFKQGYYIDPHTKKITCVQSIEHDTPWDFVCPDPERRCKLWQAIFTYVKFIPSFCLNCWKVVVRPQSIQQLFALRDLQRLMKKPAKCGIEEREYVPGLYGGYFYCNSKKEGQERYAQVRKLVSERIGLDVPVILKRYCTEFEINKGDSKDYQQPVHAKDIENVIFNIFDDTIWKPMPDKEQPWYVKLHVYHKWLKWAWKYDRINAEQYNNNEPFYTLPRTYQEA